MQFLLSVIDDQTGTATADEMAAIDAFNERLRADGHWIVACGISAPSDASIIDGRGDDPVIVDGPLHDGAEYIAGFWLVSAHDLEAARGLAIAGSKACNRRIELRPLLGG